jgi:hypothetical protein
MKRALKAGLVALALGCGETPQDGSASQGPAVAAREHAHGQVGGEVVSTVDGEPITLSEVRETATRLHLSPLDALRRLQSELAIVHRAEATPLAQDAEVRQAARRAAVRALLRTQIEAMHTPEAETPEAIETRHTEIAARLVQPERRRGTHLLVRIAEDAEPARRDAARRIAQGILDEVAHAANPLTEMDAAVGVHGAFDVAIEHLPTFARTEIEPAFADALFAPTEPSLYPQVVETSYGFHILYMEEIVPPWEVPREEWEPALRRQLSVEARAEALIDMTDALGSRETALLHPHLDEIFAQWPADEASTAPHEGP